MTRPPLRALSALVAGALLLAGCAERITRETKLSDREIAAAGDARLARKEFRDAADHFRILLEKYPASPLAERSQKLLAESLEQAGEPEQAEEAWSDFLRLHPGSPDAATALYRKGVLALRLSPPPGRDASRTREALGYFRRVAAEHPASPVAAKAAEGAAEARKRLAEGEAILVDYYLVRKDWTAAATRADRAIREYADTPVLPRLLDALARGRDGEGKAAEAEAARKTLRERFPGYEGERKR